jgi:hypothetical protein
MPTHGRASSLRPIAPQFPVTQRAFVIALIYLFISDGSLQKSAELI